MSDTNDRGPSKRPGSVSMRELQQLAKKRGAPGRSGHAQNKLKEPRNRWQRSVRYVWDKKRG